MVGTRAAPASFFSPAMGWAQGGREESPQEQIFFPVPLCALLTAPFPLYHLVWEGEELETPVRFFLQLDRGSSWL